MVIKEELLIFRHIEQMIISLGYQRAKIAAKIIIALNQPPQIDAQCIGVKANL